MVLLKKNTSVNIYINQIEFNERFFISTWEKINNSSKYISIKIEDHINYRFEKNSNVLVQVKQIKNGRYKITLSGNHELDPFNLSMIAEEFLHLYYQKNSTLVNKKVLRYWKEYLSKINCKTELPLEKTKNNEVGFFENEINLFNFPLTKNEISNFLSLYKIDRISLVSLAWGLYLYRYNEEEVIFGVNPPSNKAHYINQTAPLKLNSQDQTVIESLNMYNSTIQNHFKNQLTLFQISQSILQNDDSLYTSFVSDLEDCDCAYDFGSSPVIVKFDQFYNITIDYNEDLYSKNSIEVIIQRLKYILYQLIKNPNKKLYDINILPPSEIDLLLNKWNESTLPATKGDESFISLFEKSVEEFSDVTAIVHNGKKISYSVLNNLSNQIANFLNSQNVNNNSLVGVYTSRNPIMIASIIGIMKAGAVYVPIDNSIPADRVKSIINDGNLEIVLTSKENKEVLNKLQWECNHFKTYICLDEYDVYKFEKHHELIEEKKIWEHIVSESSNDITGGGWYSSYTGLEFSEEEMEDYSENSYKKLKAYMNKSSRILEIGCSTGLTMYKIAPEVAFYYGTDLSETIINENQRKINRENIENIEVSCLRADEIDQIKNHTFDIIIINSVTQYFPGYNYFRDIINKAVNLLGENGIIYLGDLMDQDLKVDLMESHKSYRLKNPAKRVNTKIDFSKELFISRGFLKDLAYEIPQIINIKHSRKIHSIKNELTEFRYDSILEVNKSERYSGVPFLHLKEKKQYSLEDIENQPTTFYRKYNHDSDLAYVIYTSGSTGVPKGVMITHRSFNNFVYSIQQYFRWDKDTCVLSLTNIAFDISLLELLVPLTTGSKIVVSTEEEQLNPNLLTKLINSTNVNTMQITPSRLTLMLSNTYFKESLSKLHSLLVGGEQIPLRVLKEIQEYTLTPIYNMYGPTETTIWSSIKKINNNTETVTIGEPISNTKLHVLNKDLSLTPINFIGELYIEGKGVAKGYINNETKTKESFFNIDSQQLYKTGDLAKRLPDGEIKLLGRSDFQVKINGHRIELEEIEHKLKEYSVVDDAVVLKINDTNDLDILLCAYVISNAKTTQKELREYLLKLLPEHMVPKRFVDIDTIPLTVSGKTDVNKLKKIYRTFETGSSYEKPKNENETKMKKIWEKVFNIENIGVKDNFFNLGGNSLKAAALSSEIYNELKIEVNIMEIFKNKTIRNLIQSLTQNQEKNFYSELTPIKSQNKVYPVSSAQNRLYLTEQLHNTRLAYNIPNIILINGVINIEKLSESIRKLINRHESLRTYFDQENGSVVQKIVPELDFVLPIERIYREEINEKIKGFTMPFDLSNAPLLRAKLCKIMNEENKSVLFVDVHHIIADGNSVDILIRELIYLYNDKKLEPVALQYKDFSSWQNRLLNSNEINHQKEFWVNMLSEKLPSLELPLDYTRPPVQSFAGDRVKVLISEHLTEKLKQLAKKSNNTVYMVLFAAYKVLLAKYSGKEDLIVGTVVSGRPTNDLKSTIGMFVNTLAVRSRPENEKTFSDYLIDLRNMILSGLENQDYQFEQLIEDLDISRDLSRNPLFDAVFVYQEKESDQFSFKNTETLVHQKTINTKFDISLEAISSRNQLSFNFDYSTELFSKSTIERMRSHFITILEHIVESPYDKIQDIELVNILERKKILDTFNKSKFQYNNYRCVHELFEEQVRNTPDNIAVVFNENALSYTELNEKANQLARTLLLKGINENSIVGIMTCRSVEMVIGLLAILKTGATFLSIDPAYPKKRIKYLIEDSGLNILLSDTEEVNNKLGFNGDVINLFNIKNFHEDNSNLNLNISPSDLAYIIYTSGSTGNPKGVMIEHKSLVNLCKWHENQYELSPSDRASLYASSGFDAFIWELFPYILCGASVYIIPEKIRLDMLSLNDFYIKNSINITWLPPQVYEEFRDYNNNLRLLFTGGDKVRSFKSNTYEVVNTYGPTENTVICTHYSITNEDQSNIPIGRPLDNINIYILDESLSVVPIGLPGEIYVSGEGLARGYFKREKLTEEKFVKNPFSENNRMYKTGDIGRWLSDGNIEFLGRKDNQIKVRGYRIEISEIENHLLKFEGISKAIVSPLGERGNYRLCAYLVLDKDISKKQIRTFLESSVPQYMVPSYFVILDEMPLTANGKLDYNSLPKPTLKTIDHIKKPENDTQKILLDIWLQILGKENISIDDNFFELGGDSIKALQILSAMQEYNLRVDIQLFFKYPTIEELSLKAYSTNTKVINTNEEEMTGEIKLTPIQKSFFEQHKGNINHYNQSVVLFSEDCLITEDVISAFREILKHHDGLRTLFKKKDDDYIAVISSYKEELFKVYEYNIEDNDSVQESILSMGSDIKASLDINKGPMIKVVIFHSSDGDYLLIVIHHLIIDGVAWRILLDDFMKLYERRIDRLVTKSDSLKYWGEVLTQYANNKVIEEVPYWNSITTKQTDMIKDFNNENVSKIKDMYSKEFSLSFKETDKLLRDSHKAYNSEINDLLLVGLSRALWKWSGKTKFLIDLEGHGRENIVPNIDLSRTIGWFTSVFPIVLDLHDPQNISSQIVNTKEMLRKIPNKGIGYSILKNITNKRYLQETFYTSEAEISFNYLGEFNDAIYSKSFEFSKLKSGEEIDQDLSSPYLLEFNGYVQNGELFFEVLFNKYNFSSSSITKLLNFYEDSLKDVIHHCVGKEESTTTPSDFSNDDLSVEEVEEIFNMLESSDK